MRDNSEQEIGSCSIAFGGCGRFYTSLVLFYAGTCRGTQLNKIICYCVLQMFFHNFYKQKISLAGVYLIGMLGVAQRCFRSMILFFDMRFAFYVRESNLVSTFYGALWAKGTTCRIPRISIHVASRFSSMIRRISSEIVTPNSLARRSSHWSWGLVKVTDCLAMWCTKAPSFVPVN